MSGESRDIAPDEDRLNYMAPRDNISNGPGSLSFRDLEEDTAHYPSHHAESFRYETAHCVQSRGRYNVHEPVDTTPDSVGSIEQRVFPASHQRRQASNAAAYYKSEENRLTTFSDWRHQRIVRKEDLARNGFVYTGTADKVRCVFCSVVLHRWDIGDDVEQEHRNNCPQCPFIQGENVGNIPLQPFTNGHSHANNVTSFPNPGVGSCNQLMQNRGYDIDPVEDRCGGSPRLGQPVLNGHHVSDAVAGLNNSTGDEISPRRIYSTSPRNPQMSVEPNRLATFKTWPAQIRQRPEQLARAGLYYIGDGDKVKCFHCDVLLYEWEPEDDPFVEHARWFPQCQYIRLIKGEDFVHDVQNGKVTQDNLMQTPAVLAVLYEGHSVESVQRALAVMREKEGAGVVVTAEKLLTTILELEDAATGLETTVPMDTKEQPQSEDFEKLQRENETLRDKQLCKICMERDVEVIFYPCKHFVCCASCSAAVSACPICRVAIESIDKVFMA